MLELVGELRVVAEGHAGARESLEDVDPSARNSEDGPMAAFPPPGDCNRAKTAVRVDLAGPAHLRVAMSIPTLIRKAPLPVTCFRPGHPPRAVIYLHSDGSQSLISGDAVRRCRGNCHLSHGGQPA
jgi:hypothetical protein